MDFGRLAELQLRVQHRHSDGGWGVFEPDHSAHDPAGQDPERDWAKGTIFRCTSCDTEVVVSHVEDPDARRR